MTWDEFLQKENKEKKRKRPDDEEHRIQSACVKWFKHQYPELNRILFAVPNGGKRDRVTGGKLKEEGAVAGTADLILLKGNRFYGSLCIEMKTPDGEQRPSQKVWQKEAEAAGNKYVICRSLDDFMREVTNYLKDI